ncbi:hypothetical protein SAMCCGM7_pC0734 (plasmid) [Sinorhizobium americanum CCGM7]|uniref:hypothetical protein n=1 Tax=Sinorhizobium americanum TaxID=194963 RepID=UPI0004D9DC35|nr:hypothetical protein [Sinorhizobium americanum]APG87933.1 hypothetical protein SAMCCGM7_pC0734 [Sinorhizobium americanum CCGM7]
MYPGYDFHSLPLRPDDLTLLQGIFDDEIEARHITTDSEPIPLPERLSSCSSRE